MKRKKSWVRDSSGKRRKRGLRKEKLLQQQWGEWTGITSVNSMCVFPSFSANRAIPFPGWFIAFPPPAGRWGVGRQGRQPTPSRGGAQAFLLCPRPIRAHHVLSLCVRWPHPLHGCQAAPDQGAAPGAPAEDADHREAAGHCDGGQQSSTWSHSRWGLWGFHLLRFA